MVLFCLALSYWALLYLRPTGTPSPASPSPGAPSPGAPSPGAPSPGAPSPTSPASASETQSLEESTEAISEESGIKRGGSKVTVEELAPATSNVANAMVRELACSRVTST